MSHTDFDEAMRIEDEVWRQAPKRAAQLLLIAGLLAATAMFVTGCGLVKWDDPERMYGPKSIFEKHERTSGGA